MENNVRGIQHIGIPTNNIELCKEFYKKLGFKVLQEKTLDNGVNILFIELNGVVLEFYTEKANSVNGAINHIALDVLDIEKAFATAKQLNLPIDDTEINFLPLLYNGVRYFTIIGPNNERVEFNQKL